MFKKGDKVVVIKATQLDTQLVVGDLHTISVDQEGRFVKIDGMCTDWYADRFVLAAPQVLPFVVGATVECLYVGYHFVKIGVQYPIQDVELDRLGAVYAIRVKGARYTKLDRFKVVALPVAAPAKEWNREEWVPQVGEKVYVTGRDQYFARYMAEFENNGEEYIIRGCAGRIIALDNGYSYDPSSLTPVAANGAIIKPPTPKPRPVHNHKDLRDDLMSKNCQGLCSFAFEYDDGSRFFEEYGACHARLDEYGDTTGAKNRVKLVYNLPHQIANVGTRASSFHSNCTKEEHAQCAEYIINRSPWAIAFITKDMEEACTKGLFMDVEQNVNVIAASCCALRSCYEQFDRSHMFCMLVENGVDEHAAFLTACAITEKGDKYTFLGWSGAHDVLDCNRSFDGIVKFFKEGFYTEKGTVKNPFRTHHRSYVMAEACAKYDEGERSIGRWFKNNTIAVTAGEGFYKTTAITKQSVIDVANKFSQLIKD